MPNNGRNPKVSRSAAQMTRKILVTIVAGTLSYFLAERLINDDGPLSLMTSVFCAGVVFVAQFLIDTQGQMARLEDSVDRRGRMLETAQRNHLNDVDERINNILLESDAAISVYRSLVASKLDTDHIQGLIRNAVEVDSTRPGLAAHLARSQMNRLDGFLRNLNSEGRATYDGEDRDWLLALTEQVSTSIRATSLATVDAGGINFVDAGLWGTDLGVRYVQLQRDAIAQRNITVQRIFISELPATDNNDPLKRIVRQQLDAGIEVRMLHPRDVADIDVHSIHDFILFDDEVVYEMTQDSWPALETPVTLRAEVTVVDDDIKGRKASFDVLWAQAKKPSKFK